MIAWIVYINKLINFVNFRIDVFGLFNRFWYCETTFCILFFLFYLFIFFCLKKVLEWQSWLSGPKTLFLAMVSTQTFFSLWQILDVTGKGLLCLSSWAFLLKRDQSKSKRYIIFHNFVNIRAVRTKLKQTQKNSHN